MYSVSIDLPFLDTSYEWNCYLCDWLLFDMVISRFIHIVTYQYIIGFIAEYATILSIYHILFSSVGGNVAFGYCE